MMQQISKRRMVWKELISKIKMIKMQSAISCMSSVLWNVNHKNSIKFCPLLSPHRSLWTVATVCCANRGKTRKIWRITWIAGRAWSPPSSRVSCPWSSCRTTGVLSRPRPRSSSGRRTWKKSRSWERSSWRHCPTALICEKMERKKGSSTCNPGEKTKNCFGWTFHSEFAWSRSGASPHCRTQLFWPF